jgi:hypothetical protein
MAEKPGVANYHRLYVPVEYKGQPRLLRFVMEEKNGGDGFAPVDVELYDVIVETKKPRPQQTNILANASVGGSGVSEITISEMLRGVKDAEGAPYVFEQAGTEADLVKLRETYDGYYQDTGERVVRGATAFRDAETIIRLFKAADRSTFLHEMGHFFLESRRRMALLEGVDPTARDDWNKTAEWLGVADIDFSKKLSEADAKRWKNAQEKWAAGFEKYLMEGKAPTAELAKAFKNFKKWLTDIYKAVKNILYTDADGNRQAFEINGEIRGVMDRVLASEEEIEAARAVQEAQLLAEALKKEGIPDDAAARYKALVEEGKEKAKAKLFRKLMGELKEEKRAELAERRKEIKKRVAGEVWKMPEYKALKLFRTPRERGGRLGANAVSRVGQTVSLVPAAWKLGF